jgi:hypothetical protein
MIKVLELVMVIVDIFEDRKNHECGCGNQAAGLFRQRSVCLLTQKAESQEDQRRRRPPGGGQAWHPPPYRVGVAL